MQCEEFRLWLRASGRVRAEEQEFDEASAARSSEILTHSLCLTSLKDPEKRVPAFLIIPTGRWLGDIPFLGNRTDPTSSSKKCLKLFENFAELLIILTIFKNVENFWQFGQCWKFLTRGTKVSPRHLVKVEYLSNRRTKMESVFCAWCIYGIKGHLEKEKLYYVAFLPVSQFWPTGIELTLRNLFTVWNRMGCQTQLWSEPMRALVTITAQFWPFLHCRFSLSPFYAGLSPEKWGLSENIQYKNGQNGNG